MGYRIEYGCPERQPDKPKRLGLTIVFFLAFLLLVNVFWPEGRKVLQELLWPGDMEQTQQALEVFIAQLRYGEPVSDAVESFCREILKHENFH